MIPAGRRLPELRRLIDQKGYFVLHAPRQVGKTTSLLSLAHELNAEGSYIAALVSMILGARESADIGALEGAILGSWREAALVQLPPELQPPPWPEAEPGQRIGASLAAWARSAPRPLVVFLDEIDALQGDMLVATLRQLQEGYRNRPVGFPWSLALIGLRDVRDYRLDAGDPDRRGAPSPFNILVRSFTLRDFTADEIDELYQQHTAETGQRFEADAIARAFELTQGQPWLVNALAQILVEELVPDPARAITVADVDRAREELVSRRTMHLDALGDRLRDARVRAVIAPMLAGEILPAVPNEDLRYVIDLGLVRLTATGGLDVANPIYREVIARELAFAPRASLPSLHPTWLGEGGRLDPARLCEAFLSFWRRHGEPLMRMAPYHEVAPQLVLLAFLDRVANGGGSVDREYAIGRGRMDVCLRYGQDRVGIELKVWRDGRPDPLGEGLEQLEGYLAGLDGVTAGWLVIFDQRSGLPPVEQRTSAEAARTPSGREVTILRA